MSWSTIFWIGVAACLWLPLLSLMVYAYAWLACIIWRDIQWRRRRR